MNNSFHHLTHKQILDLLQAGDKQVFEWLYKQYWQKLYQSAYKRLKDGPLCEEIVQDIFTSLWLRRETFQLTQSWDAYFYKAVQYKVINMVSAQKVRKEYINRVTFLNADNTTENHLRVEELLIRIEQGAAQLPGRCEQVFWMSRREHYSLQEIAQKLNISQKAVEKHLTKALKHLRLSLQDYLLLLLLLFSLSTSLPNCSESTANVLIHQSYSDK